MKRVEQSQDSTILLAERQAESLGPCMLLLYSYDFESRFKPSPFKSSPSAAVAEQNGVLHRLPSSQIPHQQNRELLSEATNHTASKIYERPNGLKTESSTSMTSCCDNYSLISTKETAFSSESPPYPILFTPKKGILKVNGKYSQGSNKRFFS